MKVGVIMFGFIRCSHCGKKLTVDDYIIIDNSLLCEECSNLGDGGQCNRCFRYNLIKGICNYDEYARKPENKCNVIDVYCSLKLKRTKV